MLTISSQQVSDIHALNAEFLQLVLLSNNGSYFGIDDATFALIKEMPQDKIARMAATDLLLFSIADGTTTGEPVADVAALVERVKIVARDFAREDAGLAVSYLNMSKERCAALLGMGFTQIRESSSSGVLRIIPMGTTAFRMLGQLATPAERTQYATLAAND